MVTSTTTIRLTTTEFVQSGDKIEDCCDITVSELFQAYYDCRSLKRNTVNALEFEQNLERNLMGLYHDLIEDRYQPSRSICFIVTKPKPREVWASDFRDRIVHHLIYNRYFHTFSKSFIHDSYACLPGKGTLNAAKRLNHFVRSSTYNYQKQAWYLKIDVYNFFMSINKNILLDLLSLKIKNLWWFGLVSKIVLHDATTNVHIKSNYNLQKLIPFHKSLYNVDKKCGLPIGNLSSQFFANIYLNELDQYCKRVLKIKYYIRYVDDIIVLDKDPSQLNQWYQQMESFLQHRLDLKFHPQKKSINITDKGINFVGFIVRHYCRYVRRSTISSIYQISKYKDNLFKLRNSLNSYFGIIKHSSCFNEKVKIKSFFNKYGIKFDKQLTKMVL